MNEKKNIELSHKEFENGFSLGETLQKIKAWKIYLISNIWKIAAITILGGIIGFSYAYFKPVTYNAKLSFVVEESKTGAPGLASLAGQFGFDLGGMGGGGLLSGENLLIFLKSPSLIKETLNTPYNTSSDYSLADKYADVYKLRKRWRINKKIGKDVFFPTNGKPFTTLQDSLLKIIIDRISKKELLVERPEKKATFINVETNMEDEKLSKQFCERLVDKAADRYIKSKTKRQETNVNRLQLRADSIATVLNNRTFVNADEQQKILDVNPASRTATVKAEISSRDKLMLATIYGEVIKNLEIAKVQLSQETPTIQIVDNIDFPLKKSKSILIVAILVGLLVASFLYTFFLTIKWIFHLNS